MDEVLLRQFEEYLKTNGIKSEQTKATQNDASTVRKKRSIEPNIVFTLSKEEVSWGESG